MDGRCRTLTVREQVHAHGRGRERAHRELDALSALERAACTYLRSGTHAGVDAAAAEMKECLGGIDVKAEGSVEVAGELGLGCFRVSGLERAGELRVVIVSVC